VARIRKDLDIFITAVLLREYCDFARSGTTRLQSGYGKMPWRNHVIY
jgi:hypothetical protein